MPKKTGKAIELEFCDDATLFTARAGLAPINEIAKDLKIYKTLDNICEPLRHPSYVDFKGSQIVMMLMFGLMAGLYRVHHILSSAELPFLTKLVNLIRIPVATTIFRFFERFNEPAIAAFQKMNFDLASKYTETVNGFQIIAHDQSALQKYGSKMEGVEKGYGGTLKKGSRMLQSSLIVDAGSHTILNADIRSGSTHSFKNAASEMDRVLTGLDTNSDVQRLVMGDSAYGVGEYMRVCDKHKAQFILAVKNDSWIKQELAELDMQRFHHGKENPDYGYREFLADREVWYCNGQLPLFESEDWDGTRRVVVVRLPCEKGETQKYQFLATSLSKDEFPAENIHLLYKKNRESVELINDEVQNQMGLSELPSQDLNANRAIAQVVVLAWNLQRHIEHVGMQTERKNEAIRRSKFDIEESRKTQRRFEWWSMFVRFIAVGGRLKTGQNRLVVLVSKNKCFQEWLALLEDFDWKAFAIGV